VCKSGYTGSTCSIRFIGPDQLGNSGQGGAHLIVQPTISMTDVSISGIEIFWGPIPPENPNLEIRVYTGTAGNFTLVSKQALLTSDFGSTAVKTIAIAPAVSVLQGQYVGIVNLGGKLNTPNNQAQPYGYWFAADNTYGSTVGSLTALTYWGGAPSWRALYRDPSPPSQASTQLIQATITQGVDRVPSSAAAVVVGIFFCEMLVIT